VEVADVPGCGGAGGGCDVRGGGGVGGVTEGERRWLGGWGWQSGR
jgi:hypothetical protein